MSEAVVDRLRAAGCVFAEEEATLLASAAAGGDLQVLVERRIAGEPLEQLLGWAEFGGLRIAVAPSVFVPRRRTELLVRLAVERRPRVAVDLCCGTGAVAAVMARALPDAEIHAADVDEAAVACARRNVELVHQGDLFDALPPWLCRRVDVIVANAPYVPTAEIALMPREAREHEAQVALDGGPDGLDLHRRIAAGAPSWLTPGGWLFVETSQRQAATTAAVAAAAGLSAEIVRDEELDATAVAAQVVH